MLISEAPYIKSLSSLKDEYSPIIPSSYTIAYADELSDFLCSLSFIPPPSIKRLVWRFSGSYLETPLRRIFRYGQNTDVKKMGAAASQSTMAPKL